MAAERQINADPEAVVVVHTAELPWEPTGQPGVSRKLLERVIDPEKGRETSLLKLDAGTKLAEERLAQRVEVFVLEGQFSDGHGSYGPETFVRNPAGATMTPSSDEGCVIYLKRRNPFREDDARIVIDTKEVEWMSFPHRGADVVHFYRDRHGIDTARFGEVYPEKRIPSHDHAMGEETLVVDGELKDEHGTYVAGTWFRFPVGVPHAPYTEEKSCRMLIREGDLVW